MFALTQRIARSTQQVSSDFGDEAAILRLDVSRYYGVNEVGAHIWHLIETPRSVEEICRSVEATFEVAPDVCLADTQRFLARLHAARLIDVSNPQESPAHA